MTKMTSAPFRHGWLVTEVRFRGRPEVAFRGAPSSAANVKHLGPSNTRKKINCPTGRETQNGHLSRTEGAIEAFQRARSQTASWHTFLTIVSSRRCRGKQAVGSRFEGNRNVREALATRLKACPMSTTATVEHLSMQRCPIPGISRWTSQATTREGERKEVQGCDFYTFRNAGKGSARSVRLESNRSCD